MHLKMTLYHKLSIAEIFFTDETKTEAQSTKVKVTPVPSADSRRAVVSFWQKNVHNTG